MAASRTRPFGLTNRYQYCVVRCRLDFCEISALCLFGVDAEFYSASLCIYVSTYLCVHLLVCLCFCVHLCPGPL